MSTAVALIDCNNFYISCERVFNPHLAEQAVVVLSNNDGCVIARSNEAKRLGIRMGAPAFQIAELLKHNKVAVLSSNYTLYGDMSARVMRVLEEWSPETEVYSIDEAFVNFAAGTRATPESYAQVGRELRARVLKWTGIPVTVGIAETKTLAKVAASIAKTSEKARGVLSLAGSPYTRLALSRTPVEKVWGIGRQYGEMLRRAGVMTALDLREKDDVWIRRRMSVVGVRLVQELRGVSCLPLEFAPAPKASITVSRSFGSPVVTRGEMREAVAHFAARAGEKLRKEESIVGSVVVFLSTNRFSSDPQYTSSATVRLPVTTDFTPELIRAAHRGVERIFAEGYTYKKAGVMLVELMSARPAQANLYHGREHYREEKLMRVVDAINSRFGRGAIRYLATGLQQRWQTRADHCSPRYTTHWNELLTITEAAHEAHTPNDPLPPSPPPSSSSSSRHDTTAEPREPRRTPEPFINPRFVVH